MIGSLLGPCPWGRRIVRKLQRLEQSRARREARLRGRRSAPGTASLDLIDAKRAKLIKLTRDHVSRCPRCRDSRGVKYELQRPWPPELGPCVSVAP